MFWTAVIWGLGVSLGASVGMMSFVVMFAVWGWLANTKAAKRASEVAELSLAALDKRNELTIQQIEYLAAIAAAAECYQDSIGAKESR
jgi:hypothetical protein